MPRSFKKSVAWEFFNKNFENHKIVSAQCKLCNNTYKYFGNTTNLLSHVNRKHPVQFTQLKSKQNPIESEEIDNPNMIQTDEHAIPPQKKK